MAGAIRWRNAWTVGDPGVLVTAYAAAFRSAGGEVIAAGAGAAPDGPERSVGTATGPVETRDLVVASGPWSGKWIRQLGYRLPLIDLRGYHMHYAQQSPGALRHWVMDAEAGYFVPAMGQRLDAGPRLGSRPCMPDMKPVIGHAPRHRGLWFAFGHGFHGFTLGPVTGRLLSQRMLRQCPRWSILPRSVPPATACSRGAISPDRHQRPT